MLWFYIFIYRYDFLGFMLVLFRGCAMMFKECMNNETIRRNSYRMKSLLYRAMMMCVLKIENGKCI